MEVCGFSVYCCALLYVHSSFAIILMGKRKLVALLCLSSCCLVMVVWLFLAVPWVCLRFVIMAFPDHTQLLFLLCLYCKSIQLCKNDYMNLYKYVGDVTICLSRTSSYPLDFEILRFTCT